MAETAFRSEGLTLEIERVIDAPRAAVWRCWVESALLKQWFCPRPWIVADAEIDPRPGGAMNTTMQGPDGERMEGVGAFLALTPGEYLVFTDAFAADYSPTGSAFLTSHVRLSDAPGGATRMIWGARHASAEDRDKHLAMGIEAGWAAAAGQLEAVAQAVAFETLGAPIVVRAKTRTCLFLPHDPREVAEYYTALLPDSRIETPRPSDPATPDMVVEFVLAGAPFMMLGDPGGPTPSAAASIHVTTDNQSETDRLWSALIGDGGEESKCGWLTDRYGVSWQIAPTALSELLSGADPEGRRRTMEAMFGMSKLDIAALKSAYRGA